MSPDEFRAWGKQAVDFIADYMQRLDSLPVLSSVKPGDIAAALPEHPPAEPGLAAPDFFADLERIILPGLTHWQSPNFFAYFPCNSSGPGIIGELLSAGLNVNGMLWATSPAATELETRMLDWMAEMLDLPAHFRSTSMSGGGCIQGTASESTLVALLAARHRARLASPTAHLTLYTSTQAHSSIIKAAMIAGLATDPDDRTHIRLIGTDANHAMRPDLLRAAITEDLHAGRFPFYTCATVGTTSSTAIDPIPEIADILHAAAPGCWLHIDAAFAGAACICPEHRWMLRGVEHTDSVMFNPHKWLLTNFDCNCFWTRDRSAVTAALSITPEYLRNQATQTGEVIDYRDWQIPLGRRFRALKLWLVIRHYGVEGLRVYIREHIRLATLFEQWVREDERFELAAPRTCSLVCFRLRGQGPSADEANRKLLERINASGRAYLSHTTLRGSDGNDRFILRMAIGASATEERHVRAAWELIRDMV
jgi:aromatic-L-amino-acid decarboxylase